MRLSRFAALFLLAVAGAAFMVSGAVAAGGASGVVGHVYVNDNTAPVNSVAGFDRHADGSLTPMRGSPFTVGGSGAGHADASQGSLELSADGRYLLAVDAGSNQISVLRIKPDGSLQLAGEPVASGGVDPVSIGVHGNLVYVANAGPGSSPGDTNYTGFRLNPGGQLRPIPGSTYVLPNDSKPGQVLFNGDGTRVAGTRISTSLIDSFTVGDDGRLTAGSRLALRCAGVHAGAGLWPVRQRVQPHRPERAVRLGRPHRGRGRRLPRARLQLQRRSRRHAHSGRSPGRQRRRRGLLDRDQPRRHVPLRREHRVGLDLELLDRRRRLAHVPPEHWPGAARRRR